MASALHFETMSLKTLMEIDSYSSSGSNSVSVLHFDNMSLKTLMKINYYSSSGSNSKRLRKRRFISFSIWLGEGMMMLRNSY